MDREFEGKLPKRTQVLPQTSENDAGLLFPGFLHVFASSSFLGRVLDWLELYLIDLHCPKNSLHVMYIVFSIAMKVNFLNGIDRAWMK